MMNQEAPRQPLETKTGNVLPQETPAAEKRLVENVRVICAALVRAASATKIFPPGHNSITRLRNAVFARLHDFLNDHLELELEVKQNAFLFLDVPVLQDDNPLSSLPYFFHKDGMQKLTFMRGLTSQEFSDFLDVVRNVSLLPVDVGDIVDALWQRDFEHIRNLSPDEFIEAKLSGDQNLPHEFDIQRDSLYTGTLEFTAEDAEEIFRRSMELCRKDPLASGEAEGLFAPLAEGDVLALEGVLEAERRESIEKEFPEIMFEVLRLEDRPEDFARILSSLENYLFQLALKMDFSRAIRFLNRMDELAGLSAAAASWKNPEIEKFFAAVRAGCPLDKIMENTPNQRVANSKTFFEYLGFVGPDSLSVAAELFERSREAEFRNDARPYLGDMARRAPQHLISLAGEDKPEFAKAVIDVFRQTQDAAIIPFLVALVSKGRKDVKLLAMRALGKFSDPAAQESLAGFLRDRDEELRVEALKNITAEPGGGLARQLAGIASEKHFRRKSGAEKEAVLKALARTGTDEACDVLRKLIKRSSLLGRAKALETRLGAVRALEKMATPAAVAALKAHEHRRPKIVRREVRSALKRLAFGPISELGRPA